MGPPRDRCFLFVVHESSEWIFDPTKVVSGLPLHLVFLRGPYFVRVDWGLTKEGSGLSRVFKDCRPDTFGKARCNEDSASNFLGNSYVTFAMCVVRPVSGYIGEGDPCHERGGPFYLFGVIAFANDFGPKKFSPPKCLIALRFLSEFRCFAA